MCTLREVEESPPPPPQILHISDAETMQFGGYDIHIGSETLIIVTLPGME